MEPPVLLGREPPVGPVLAASTPRSAHLKLLWSGTIQPCHRHKLNAVAPLGEADDPSDVTPHFTRGMIEHEQLQAALGIQSHTPHHLERLSNGIHVFVPQLRLHNPLIFLVLCSPPHTLLNIHFPPHLPPPRGAPRSASESTLGSAGRARGTQGRDFCSATGKTGEVPTALPSGRRAS